MHRTRWFKLSSTARDRGNRKLAILLGLLRRIRFTGW